MKNTSNNEQRPTTPTTKGWKFMPFRGATHVTRPEEDRASFIVKASGEVVRTTLYHGVRDSKPIKRGEVPQSVVAEAKRLAE